MNLGELIYSKRKENGLSQEQLAEILQVARQTISKWETGEIIPDVESLRKLAIALEFSIDEVLGVEVDDEDNKSEWLIIGGFIIGNALGLVFDSFMFGYTFAMIGLGIGFIMKVFKK